MALVTKKKPLKKQATQKATESPTIINKRLSQMEKKLAEIEKIMQEYGTHMEELATVVAENVKTVGEINRSSQAVANAMHGLVSVLEERFGQIVVKETRSKNIQGGSMNQLIEDHHTKPIDPRRSPRRS